MNCLCGVHQILYNPYGLSLRCKSEHAAPWGCHVWQRVILTDAYLHKLSWLDRFSGGSCGIYPGVSSKQWWTPYSQTREEWETHEWSTDPQSVSISPCVKFCWRPYSTQLPIHSKEKKNKKLMTEARFTINLHFSQCKILNEHIPFIFQSGYWGNFSDSPIRGDSLMVQIHCLPLSVSRAPFQ